MITKVQPVLQSTSTGPSTASSILSGTISPLSTSISIKNKVGRPSKKNASVRQVLQHTTTGPSTASSVLSGMISSSTPSTLTTAKNSLPKTRTTTKNKVGRPSKKIPSVQSISDHHPTLISENSSFNIFEISESIFDDKISEVQYEKTLFYFRLINRPRF